MSDVIFRQCLTRFIRNFAYGDAVRHLYKRGYSTERIIRDYSYPFTREELEEIRDSLKEGDEWGEKGQLKRKNKV